MANLRQDLRPLLTDLGVSASAIDQEFAGMQDYSVGRTASRKVLGHMRDFALNIAAALEMHPGMSLHALSGALSRIPCGPVQYTYPAEVARELLEG